LPGVVAAGFGGAFLTGALEGPDFAAPCFAVAFFAVTLRRPDFAAPSLAAAFLAVALGALDFVEVTLVGTAFFCGTALLAEAAFFTAMLNPFKMALGRPRGKWTSEQRHVA
jgi:hypothetical protein